MEVNWVKCASRRRRRKKSSASAHSLKRSGVKTMNGANERPLESDERSGEVRRKSLRIVTIVLGAEFKRRGFKQEECGVFMTERQKGNYKFEC